MELNDIQRKYINQKLEKLQHSKFRSSFKLTKKAQAYIEEKGFATIEKHCEDFIEKRLSPYPTINDGKQTPMRGHPVFIAQHATATCCRGCLNKWYNIPKNRSLTAKEKRFIKALIISWLQEEIKWKKYF